MKILFSTLLALGIAGCSAPSGKSGEAKSPSSGGQGDLQYDQRGLPTVDGQRLEPAAGDGEAAAQARALPGSRGAHQKAYDDGVPLLPADRVGAAGQLRLTSSLPVVVCIDVDGVAKFGDQCADGAGTGSGSGSPPSVDPPVGDNCEEGERRRVCAEACATATAQAYAFAFAHASTTACAWASAFACVWSREPFAQVCSWAQSSACSTAFASAFGFGFAVDTQTVCNKQCSE